jgi:hypothetical protein
VFSEKLTNFLGTSIGFLWPESYFAMIRVSYAVLGFL